MYKMKVLSMKKTASVKNFLLNIKTMFMKNLKKDIGTSIAVMVLAYFCIGMYQGLHRMAVYAAICGLGFFLATKLWYFVSSK